MLYPIILLSLLSTLPALVSSLSCYSCKLILVNYLVTSDTVPSFTECKLVNSTDCSIVVSWDLTDMITTIVVDTQMAPPPQNVTEDFITPIAFMEMISNQETALLSHALFFSCMSSDKCNDETNLKRILRSLVIEDKFHQELYPLLKSVSPFDPNSAACFEFSNATDDCPSKDLDHCRRCQTTVDKSFSVSSKVCATCPRYSIDANGVIRSAIFLLNNRTQLVDHVELDCQLKGCNSLDNINRIYKASKITFDFDKFVRNSLHKTL